jgi:hypothetical protein
MAIVAAVTPCESRRLIPNRGRFTPFVEVGRGEGGWYWRLRLTHLGVDVTTQWRGAFISKNEALAAGLVNFNTICAIKDGTLMQRFEAAALDPVDLVRESVEK